MANLWIGNILLTNIGILLHILDQKEKKSNKIIFSHAPLQRQFQNVPPPIPPKIALSQRKDADSIPPPLPPKLLELFLTSETKGQGNASILSDSNANRIAAGKKKKKKKLL
jgi:hypothetical protein